MKVVKIWRACTILHTACDAFKAALNRRRQRFDRLDRLRIATQIFDQRAYRQRLREQPPLAILHAALPQIVGLAGMLDALRDHFEP